MPVAGDDRVGGDVDRRTIIHEFLLDVGLSESNLSRDLPELRGYLRGQLGL